MASSTEPTKSEKPQRPRRSLIGRLFRAVLYLIVTIVFVILCTAGGAVYLYTAYFTAPAADSSTPEATFIIEIPKNLSLKEIARTLESKGMLTRWWTLYTLARATGQDRLIHAGEFEINNTMDVAAVLNRLVKGPAVKRKVLKKEGSLVAEIPTLFEAAGILPADTLRTALGDAALRTSLGLPAEAKSFEGYLFPETYHFSRPITPATVLGALVRQGEQLWTPEWEAARQKRGLTRHQVMTFASIVEKESGSIDEQPQVASVFFNRLKLGMRLQSDPTVIYGIPQFDGNLTRDHLIAASEYNTYVISGLPPGPIANPGRTAITATLFPAETDYLYFVADGNGRHVFSRSLQEHNNAVNRYQRGRSP